MPRYVRILTNPSNTDVERLLQFSATLPCQACGHSPAGAAMLFVPNEPWRYIANAPRDGAKRSLIYPICEPCRKLGRADEIEDKLALENGGTTEPPVGPMP